MPHNKEKSNPLGTRAVKDTLCVPETNQVLSFNFFNSHKLIEVLSELGFSTTGTMRENRSMKCTVTSIAEMKKKERWSYDHQSVENITVIR